jgi:hypothetical protein
VIFEPKDDCYFMARAIGNAVDANVSPSGFESPKVAIRAATSWADLLVAEVIYVRDGVRLRFGRGAAKPAVSKSFYDHPREPDKDQRAEMRLNERNCR